MTRFLTAPLRSTCDRCRGKKSVAWSPACAPETALDEVTDHAVAASGGWPGAALAAAVSYVA